MATFRFVNRTSKLCRPFELIQRYIINREKAKNGLIGQRMVENDIACCKNFIAIMNGIEDDAELLHFVLTFSPEEINDPPTAYGFAEHIMGYIATKYQVWCAVHEDTDNLHIHFVFSSISYLDGSDFRETDNRQLTDFVAEILRYRKGLILNQETN